jgi:hypothetical protein
MSDQTQDSRNAAVPAPPSKVHLLTWLCAEVRDEGVDDPAQETSMIRRSFSGLDIFLHHVVPM